MCLGIVGPAQHWPPSRHHRHGKPDHVCPVDLPDRIGTPEEIHDILVGLANSYEEDIVQFDHEEISRTTEWTKRQTPMRTTTTEPPPIVWFPSEPECPGTDSENGETAMFLFGQKSVKTLDTGYMI